MISNQIVMLRLKKKERKQTPARESGEFNRKGKPWILRNLIYVK